MNKLVLIVDNFLQGEIIFSNTRKFEAVELSQVFEVFQFRPVQCVPIKSGNQLFINHLVGTISS